MLQAAVMMHNAPLLSLDGQLGQVQIRPTGLLILANRPKEELLGQLASGRLDKVIRPKLN
jgi:hypothetical protein